MQEKFKISIKPPPDIAKMVSARCLQLYNDHRNKQMLVKFGRDNVTTQDVLKLLLTKPKNKNEEIMREYLNKPEVISETVEKATKDDFRAFLRDVLDEEREFIPESLHRLREADDEAYQRTLQSWAKLALPPQDKNTNVNIEIEQKVHIYDRLSQMYGYSKEVEGLGLSKTELRELENPAETDLYLNSEIEDVPDFEDLSGTLDGDEDDDQEDHHPTPVRIPREPPSDNININTQQNP